MSDTLEESFERLSETALRIKRERDELVKALKDLLQAKWMTTEYHLAVSRAINLLAKHAPAPSKEDAR